MPSMVMVQKFIDSILGTKESEVTEEKKVTGKVTKVDKNKGYGFITSKDVPFTRIFFHWTALLHNTTPFLELTTGMKVEFIAQKMNDDKGWRALKIKVID